ncbi:uracil-DNA glycosylase [Rickettsiales bacterium]|nr:uracil-DNA glycosylase [Rickettsiales bacterium]
MNNIIKLHQEFGIDEIISDKPINRFQLKREIEDQKSDNKDGMDYKKLTSFDAINKLADKNKKITHDSLTPINEIIKEARILADNAQNIEELKDIITNFEGCSLKKMATNTVFADGNPNSEIMVIGEAPANDEDLQGIPFCGDSGQLLNAMFQAINIAREDLYISNILFWRPPGNRRPTKDEIEICRPFVEKHIALIKPKLIILMGASAMIQMTDTKKTITQLRGKFLEYNNCYLEQDIQIITMFHPSYLIRQPIKKKLAWKDLLNIKEFINK